MSSERQQYVQIDAAVNEYIDRSEQSNHKFFKLWHIAFSGMEQMGLDFFYRIKSVKLPVNANLTVNLPADYLNYTKIGVLNNNGEIIPLDYNSKLTTYADLLPTRLEQTQDPTLISYYQCNTPVWYNYWNDGTYSNLYGVPSGAPFVGSFKIDNDAGIVLLGESFGWPYLMVEYLASPTPEPNGNYQIPMQFKEALISYIGWKDIEFIPSSRRGTLGDREQRKRNFFNERRLAVARWKPITIAEAYQANLESQRLTIKA